MLPAKRREASMLSGGYGLRLFAGFAGLVLLMLIVSAVVFFSLFGGYREDIDRSDLRRAGNALSVQIGWLLRSSVAQDRDVLFTLIREQAEESGLIVILSDGDGRVLSGFEARSLPDDKSLFSYAAIVKKGTHRRLARQQAARRREVANGADAGAGRSGRVRALRQRGADDGHPSATSIASAPSINSLGACLSPAWPDCWSLSSWR